MNYERIVQFGKNANRHDVSCPLAPRRLREISPMDSHNLLERPLGGRLSGPGGFYNLGNVIALVFCLGIHLAQESENSDFFRAFTIYFAGSPGAAWLTVAMVVHLVAGEIYHRAWVRQTLPDQRLNRLGDFISGLGGLAITAALVHFGDLVLAFVAGTLFTGGKIGTALLTAAGSASDRSFRLAVVTSRFPSIAALVLELWRNLVSAAPVAQSVLPFVMIYCFLLWFAADLLLLRGFRSKTTVLGRANHNGL